METFDSTMGHTSRNAQDDRPRYLQDGPYALAVDTETKGLRWWDDGTPFIATASDFDRDYLYRFNEKKDPAWLREAILRADTLIFHNASFDIHVLVQAGVVTMDEILSKRIEDTDLLARCVLGAANGPFGLKRLATEYVDSSAGDAEQAMKEAMVSMGIIRKVGQKDVGDGAFFRCWEGYPQLVEEYARLDTRYTYDLYHVLKGMATPEDHRVYELERAAMPVVIRMEHVGLRLDQEKVVSLRRKFIEQRDRTHEALLALNDGVEINFDSTAQVAGFLQAQGVPLTATTPTGEIRTDKWALEKFEESYFAVRLLSEYRQAQKFLSTYIEPMIGRDVVHPSFWQIGARTGRMSCIAEGSLVDCPRDLEHAPLGVPIEHIQVGQYVYSFGSDGVPRPARVLAKTNMGEKRVLRLVYQASGHSRYMGELRATPDHLIRMRDGRYVRMDDLKPGDQLAFISRGVYDDGYARIGWGGAPVREHHHLCNGHEVVHHLDHRKLNNALDNLHGMTASQHARIIEHGVKYRTVRFKPCPYTREEFECIVADGVRRAINTTGHDHSTLKRWAIEFGVCIPDARRRRDVATNHRVVSVVSDGETVPVWDLTIEGTPNFVVNEIAVHNCSNPNLQNIPVRSGPEVREVFVPRDGHVFIVADYSSIELRLIAYYMNHEELWRIIEEGDPFLWLGEQIYGTSDPASWPVSRSKLKNGYYALTYGAGGPKLAATIGGGMTPQQGKQLASSIRGALGKPYRVLNQRIREQVESSGFLRTMGSRTQHVSPDKSYVGLNALIQGSAADIMKWGLVKAAKAIEPFGGYPVLVVHDEIVAEVPAHHADDALVAMKQAMVDATDLLPLKTSGTVAVHSYAEGK